jgi:hypothetical protein
MARDWSLVEAFCNPGLVTGMLPCVIIDTGRRKSYELLTALLDL